jgi:hypothetical protein
LWAVRGLGAPAVADYAAAGTPRERALVLLEERLLSDRAAYARAAPAAGTSFEAFAALVEAPFRSAAPRRLPLVQALLSAAAVLAVFALGCGLGGPLAGLLGALLCALDPAQIAAAAGAEPSSWAGLCLLAGAAGAAAWAEGAGPLPAAAGLSAGALACPALLWAPLWAAARAPRRAAALLGLTALPLAALAWRDGGLLAARWLPGPLRPTLSGALVVEALAAAAALRAWRGRPGGQAAALAALGASVPSFLFASAAGAQALRPLTCALLGGALAAALGEDAPAPAPAWPARLLAGAALASVALLCGAAAAERVQARPGPAAYSEPGPRLRSLWRRMVVDTDGRWAGSLEAATSLVYLSQRRSVPELAYVELRARRASGSTDTGRFDDCVKSARLLLQLGRRAQARRMLAAALTLDPAAARRREFASLVERAQEPK